MVGGDILIYSLISIKLVGTINFKWKTEAERGVAKKNASAEDVERFMLLETRE